jgi:murein DD-endopeptidase MepM/ murein hydrolase activator NlpD
MRFGSTQALTLGSPNRRRHRRLLLVLLLLPVLSGLFVAPTNPVRGDELADAKAKKEAIEKKIKAQKAQVAQLNTMQADLRGEIARTTRALGEINADLKAVRASIAKMVERIDQVRAKYESLVAELTKLDAQLTLLIAKENAKRLELRERKALLADRLRQAYDTDRVSLLETFLSGGSFSDMLTEVSYQLDVGAQDRALAEQIKEDQATLAALHATVEATREETNLLRQETAVQKKLLDRQLAELKVAQQRLKELEAATARELAQQKAAYRELERSRKNLAAAIRRAAAAQKQLANKIDKLIAEQAQQGNIPSEYNGQFGWPMRGRISGEFGCSSYPGYGPGQGCAHFHNGIDIVAPCGTPVRAAGAGRVAYIGWNWADGPDPAWIVVIAHSTGLTTWYAHMKPSAPGGIGTGSAVKGGQVIGYEGSTGHSTGCHLHWMVELNGTFRNPRLFL